MDEDTPSSDGSGLDAAPGLARIAAGAWLRTAGWTAGSTVRAGARVTRAALSGESPATLLREVGSEAVEVARRILGVTEIERRLLPERSLDTEPLLMRGAELLERSSDLEEHDDVHPAYARILEQLSPDEARILRLLATEGPQPAVDIRTWRPLDLGSRVTAPGLTMLGRNAGVMHPDRIHPYLSNLFRLGLIWFNRDELPEPGPYQVLEAQPEVVEAIRATGRARIVRRSIQLTPFGGHFCHYCLPLGSGELTDEFATLEPEPLEADGEPELEPSAPRSAPD